MPPRLPGAAGTLPLTAIFDSDEAASIEVADAQEPRVPSVDTVMADATVRDDDRALVFSGSLAGIPFNETSETLAGLLPDWLGYVAAVGILVLSRWKTARCPRWRRQSDPEDSFGRNRFDRPGSEPADSAPHTTRCRPGWFRRRHGTGHSVVTVRSE